KNNFEFERNFSEIIKMDNKFNRRAKSLETEKKGKTKVEKSLAKSKPSSEEIALATQEFLKKGGEIERISQHTTVSQNEVFRANMEPESRLGMGTIVDDSWDCWENKSYDTNPSGPTL
ncbi:MAG: hypothetical protein VYC02_06335, partial [SAR324 cluster bacterium]|nr:hypothetical protein [SAR324 cluster bacterium]